MTHEQFEREIRYQASIIPFRRLLENGIISASDFNVIDATLAKKYSPVFVGYMLSNEVDISSKQR